MLGEVELLMLMRCTPGAASGAVPFEGGGGSRVMVHVLSTALRVQPEGGWGLPKQHCGRVVDDDPDAEVLSQMWAGFAGQHVSSLKDLLQVWGGGWGCQGPG